MSSKARNAAATAISSGVPKRRMGLSATRSALNCSAASAVIVLSRIPVSTGPGLTALTRIPRDSRSRERVRAIERRAALPAA
ncbi:hypothetical protein SGRIM128S_09775 [Streptomyces griseomycini]